MTATDTTNPARKRRKKRKPTPVDVLDKVRAFIDETRSDLIAKRDEAKEAIKDWQDVLKQAETALEAFDAFHIPDEPSDAPARPNGHDGRVSPELIAQRDQIVGVIRDNPGITPKDIIEKTGLPKVMVDRGLLVLRKHGRVVTERKGVYTLPPAAEPPPEE